MRFFFPIVFLCAACLNDPDCLVATTNLASFNFKKADGKTADTLWIDSIRVSGYKTQFTINDQDAARRNVTGVRLPVYPGDAQTTYTYYYKKKKDKTQQTAVLTFSYYKNIKVISKKCGAFVFYENLSLVKTTAGPVKIVQPQLNTTVTSNAEIVF
ncbi:MAG: hypothetical protein CRN43_07005 [Candidatus Nephrothrix sp. EaCA]|nr:MAG: hypothetical protein CRN43_07005 [Candidatus Nephrothrix sp. EaCA]